MGITVETRRRSVNKSIVVVVAESKDARCEIPWDPAMGSYENHKAAVAALAAKLGLQCTWVGAYDGLQRMYWAACGVQ